MIRLILIVVILVLVVRLVLRLLAQQRPRVTATPGGISVRGRGVTLFVGWSEIRQIDVCRMPTAGATDFAIVLFGNSTVEVHGSYSGFADFTRAMFERWPAIRPEWNRVSSGPPDISERVTVWTA